MSRRMLRLDLDFLHVLPHCATQNNAIRDNGEPRKVELVGKH